MRWVNRERRTEYQYESYKIFHICTESDRHLNIQTNRYEKNESEYYGGC